MRLLIVGAGGQLGSDLRAAAESEGRATTTLGRADLDVTSAGVEEALAAHEFDALVNCTAYNDTSGAESDPAAAFAVNAWAPERLARAARTAGARFVHVSTDYVFDGRTDRPYTEEDAPAPLGVYGASKLTGEAVARRAHPEGTLVVRTAAVFGLAAVPSGGNFVETILKAAAGRGPGDDPLRVVDDVVVSPTGSADLALAILGLLDAGAAPGLYHVVNRGRASWYEFARAIVERSGSSAAVEPVPASAYSSAVRRPAFSVLDPGRASKIVGPLPHWREALDRYLDGREGRVAPAGDGTGDERGADG